MVERLAVALAWEIDPLRVPKLVTHEVKPRLAAQRELQQSRHLVQRDAPLNRGVHALLASLAHAPVHRGVHQCKRERLIPDETLIVGFEVTHRRFGVATGDEGDDPRRAPVEVGFVRQPSPVIWRPHGQPQVKT